MKHRLLFFASDYQIGLTQANTEVVTELQRSQLVDMLCVTSEKEQETGLHEKLEKAGVRKRIISGLDVHDRFKEKAQAIRDIMYEHRATHLNVQNNWQLALAAYVKCRYDRRIKIVYTIHGYRHNNPLKALLAIAMIGTALWLFADRVISMSSYVSRRFWFIAYKTDIVFYMMNKPQYAKKENHIEPLPIRIVFPAQFRNGKNQHKVIRAVKHYVERTSDRSIKLCLPGNGPRLEEMKTLARTLRLTENIQFPGKLNLDDVFALYEDANIALCASNVETYGRCIVEPFMLGRCVLTRRTGVALDIIRNGENGAFFRDEKELTNLLVQLHRNPQHISSMAQQAFKDRAIFSAPNVLKSYLAVLDKA